jgi:hypothetical protein
MSATGAELEPGAYGNLCPLCTAKAPRATQTFGKPQSCLESGIGLLEKTVVLPNYIERFNNTLRQRVGRLVRRSLSFSKKLSNHLGAIGDFIHYYNAALTI